MLPVTNIFWLGRSTYGHCGDDIINALIDEANDVLLNAIGGIPEHIPVCASKTVL